MPTEKYHVDLKDARGVSIGDNNVLYQYFLPEKYRPLSEHFISFDGLIAERVKDFMGRGFVFRKLDAFFDQHNQGYFVLEGEPGIGKTALIAQLASTQQYLHHFNIAALGICQPEQFLESICAQLTARYDLGYDDLPPNVGRDGSYLDKLLRQVGEKVGRGPDKLVILVDGLDEVQMSMRGANVLFLPENLPHSVFFVLTTRPKRLSLKTDAAFHRFLLDPYSEDNQIDVKAYIEGYSKRERMRSSIRSLDVAEAEFVAVLLDKSEGNFMYLHYILPAIEEDPTQYDGLAKLPQGLTHYYQKHWDRMRLSDEDVNWERRIKIVYVLSEVEDAISLDLITKYTDDEPHLVQRVLEEWSPFLDKERIGGKRYYRIYHASFRDFLHRDEIVQAAGLTLEGVSEVIADHQLKALGIDLREKNE